MSDTDAENETNSTTDERSDDGLAEDGQPAATITGSTTNLRRMVTESSVLASGDPLYDRLYVNVTDGQVNLVGGTRSGGVMSYCTYDSEYFKEASGEVEAVVEVAAFLNYLDIASDGGQLTLRFHQDDDARLAQQLEIAGKLTSSIMLPSGSSVMQNIPLGVIQRFDDDDEMLDGAGDQLSTKIWTTAGDLSKIVDAVALQDSESFYPVVVEDGEFVIELGNRQTQYISGDLSGEVEGDDVHNEFADEFETIVDSLSGDVQISTEEGQVGSFVVDGSDHVTRTVMGVARDG